MPLSIRWVLAVQLSLEDVHERRISLAQLHHGWAVAAEPDGLCAEEAGAYRPCSAYRRQRHTPARGVVDVHPVDLGPRASDFELELCNNIMEL